MSLHNINMDVELKQEQEYSAKISAVTDYIEEISNIRKELLEKGSSEILFFRGQSNSLWDIRPAIYRDSLISVEDEIIQKATSRVPNEFYNASDFDILTKLQHYGLPTRLLDVTMNPLVALYFACCTKEYINNTDEAEEVDGVVFYSSAYGENSLNREIQFLSTVAKERIDGDCTLKKLAESLNLSYSKTDSFINMLQSYHFVLPSYSNSRIISQSGAFLLSGAINVYEDPDDIWNSKVQKSVCSLKEAFSKEKLIIDSNAKNTILDELDFLNINEGSLFPELEHQMSHVKRIGTKSIHALIPEFIKYNIPDLGIPFDDEDNIEGNIREQKIKNIVGHWISDKDILEEIMNEIIQTTKYPDWVKKDSIKSSMQISIKRILSKKKKRNAKDIAYKIVQNLIKQIS